MTTNREGTIGWFKKRMEADRDGAKERIARALAKMSTGKPYDFEYEVRWGNGVAEAIEAHYLDDMIDLFGKCERGELEGTKTVEALCAHFVSTLTNHAMQVEHSSNAFACAVSLTRQEVAKSMRETWINFERSLAHATEEDAQLAREAKLGVSRTSIDAEKRIVTAEPQSERATSARKMIAAMRRRLKEKLLSETHNQHRPFWVSPGDAIVFGMVGQDELLLTKAEAAG